MGWVNATPRPFYRRERQPVPILQEAGWAPVPVWTGEENLAPQLNSIPRTPSPRVATPSTFPGPWMNRIVNNIPNRIKPQGRSTNTNKRYMKCQGHARNKRRCSFNPCNRSGPGTNSWWLLWWRWCWWCNKMELHYSSLTLKDVKRITDSRRYSRRLTSVTQNA